MQLAMTNLAATQILAVRNVKDMTEPILRVNQEESMCVTMKCNTVLPGKTY